jgi:hypothetical protein
MPYHHTMLHCHEQGKPAAECVRLSYWDNLVVSLVSPSKNILMNGKYLSMREDSPRRPIQVPICRIIISGQQPILKIMTDIHFRDVQPTVDQGSYYVSNTIERTTVNMLSSVSDIPILELPHPEKSGC